MSKLPPPTAVASPNAESTSHRAAPGGATARALKLWVVLSRAYRAIEAHASADAARHGLTLAEFGVIEALYHRGDMLLSELQRRILVSSGGITFLVDRLSEKGLVRRRACPGDRRARFVSLTAAGEQTVRGIFPEHAARIEQLCAVLTMAEQQEATALLRTLGHAAAAAPLAPASVVETGAEPAAELGAAATIPAAPGRPLRRSSGPKV